MDGEFGGLSLVERVFFGVVVFVGYGDLFGFAGVIERDVQDFFSGAVEGIERHDEGFFFELRIYVEIEIDVACVRAARVDEVGIQNGAMFFVEGSPFFDEGFGFVGVVEAWAAVAGLDAGAKIVCES